MSKKTNKFRGQKQKTTKPSIILFVKLWIYYLLKNKNQNKKRKLCYYHSSNPPLASDGFQNKIQILYHVFSCMSGSHSLTNFKSCSSITQATFIYIVVSSTSDTVFQNLPQMSLNILSYKGLMSIPSQTSKVFTNDIFLLSSCIFLLQPLTQPQFYYYFVHLVFFPNHRNISAPRTEAFVISTQQHTAST